MAGHLESVQQAVIERRRSEIRALVQQALDAGLDPSAIVNDALIAAMDAVGKDFGAGKIFVPELLVSAVTMKDALEVVRPFLTGGQDRSRGTIVMATVKGDLHDIGKNLVSMLLEGAGFTVVDLGVDLNAEKLVEQVKVIRPQVLGLSALLTTTMPEMRRVIGELKAQRLRDNVKVMVGGAPLDRAFAEKIGADGYGADAAEAVQLARRFVGA